MHFLQYLTAFLLLLVSSHCLSDNTLKNTSFMDLESENSTSLKHWRYDGWNLNAKQSFFALDTVHSRRHVTIHHKTPSHSYLTQKVLLEKNTIYRFSASAKSTNTEPTRIAAAIGVVGRGEVAATTAGRRGWQRLSLYIQNADERKHVALMLSFGHYSNLNKGQVAFDAVKFEKVAHLPNTATKIVYGKPKFTLPKFYYLPPQNGGKVATLLFILLVLAASAFWRIRRWQTVSNRHKADLQTATDEPPHDA